MINKRYYDYVDQLLKKYGPVPEAYFKEKAYIEKGRWVHNSAIKRGSEGLFIHHIDEDKYINLSLKGYYEMLPFELHAADRLVYCNYLEHTRLHLLIAETPFTAAKSQPIQFMINTYDPAFRDYADTSVTGKQKIVKDIVPEVGIDGATKYLIPTINNYFNKKPFVKEWQRKAVALVDYNEYRDLLIEYIEKGLLTLDHVPNNMYDEIKHKITKSEKEY